MTVIYERAVRTWGADAQIDMAIEEMAELTTALLHWRRGRSGQLPVASEIADVEIMMAQLRVLIPSALVDREKASKLGRLADRLEKAESE